MPAAISVSDDDIAFAERILLPAGAIFDHERRCFIKDMRKLDLQAVPGSGKTTALLAKLLILDRYLPFKDGSGILVISHTNAAIDEIKGKIGVHCVNLFRFPSFVGTIQAFVDEFLAVPFYTNKYGVAPIRIDDDIYDQRFAAPPSFGVKGFCRQETNNALRFLRANTKKIRWTFANDQSLLTEGYGGKRIDFKKPRGNTKPQNYQDWSETEKSRVCEWVRRFKLSIMKSGCLCYDDAYFLARVALVRLAPIKTLLQRRFAHVFVDEMQDMEQHQYELLEDLFYDNGGSAVAYQRIGDRNQSIFDGRNSAANNFWTDRSTVLELNGSYRLSPVLAAVVNAFAINPTQIEGRRKNPDGSDISVKPRLIVYSDSTRGQVISQFALAIRQLIDEGLMPVNPSNRYKAVAWATKGEHGKIRLPDYYPSYVKGELEKRIDHPDLASYLVSPHGEDRSLASVEKAIVSALLRILRLEKVHDFTGRQFTKRTMHDFLRGTDLNYWGMYQSNVYAWCLGLVRGDAATVLVEIRNHLPTFLSVFDCHVGSSQDFVHSCENATGSCGVASEKKARNVLVCEGIEVEVATVHRVKGETHTATLYMESFYERGGGGNYESERLAEQFNGQPINGKIHDLVRQSAKMVYVGFSRPTHLLCFAVHDSRFTKIEAGINRGIWDVVHL